MHIFKCNLHYTYNTETYFFMTWLGCCLKFKLSAILSHPIYLLFFITKMNILDIKSCIHCVVLRTSFIYLKLAWTNCVNCVNCVDSFQKLCWINWFDVKLFPWQSLSAVWTATKKRRLPLQINKGGIECTKRKTSSSAWAQAGDGERDGT